MDDSTMLKVVQKKQRNIKTRRDALARSTLPQKPQSELQQTSSLPITANPMDFRPKTQKLPCLFPKSPGHEMIIKKCYTNQSHVIDSGHSRTTSIVTGIRVTSHDGGKLQASVTLLTATRESSRAQSWWALPPLRHQRNSGMTPCDSSTSIHTRSRGPARLLSQHSGVNTGTPVQSKTLLASCCPTKVGKVCFYSPVSIE